MINRRIPAMAFAALCAMGMAVAAHANLDSQQERMRQCNVEAKAHSLAGDARKQFMRSCLSTHQVPKHALNRQQLKMKTCSADAKSRGLSGAERTHFMSACLKKD